MELKDGRKERASPRSASSPASENPNTQDPAARSRRSEPDEDIRREAQQSLRAVEGAPRAAANGSALAFAGI